MGTKNVDLFLQISSHMMELLQYALERNRNPLDINNFALYICFYLPRLREFQMLFSSARRESGKARKMEGRKGGFFALSRSPSLSFLPILTLKHPTHSLTRTPLADEKVKFQLFFRRRCQRQRKRENFPPRRKL